MSLAPTSPSESIIAYSSAGLTVFGSAVLASAALAASRAA